MSLVFCSLPTAQILTNFHLPEKRPADEKLPTLTKDRMEKRSWSSSGAFGSCKIGFSFPWI